MSSNSNTDRPRAVAEIIAIRPAAAVAVTEVEMVGGQGLPPVGVYRGPTRDARGQPPGCSAPQPGANRPMLDCDPWAATAMNQPLRAFTPGRVDLAIDRLWLELGMTLGAARWLSVMGEPDEPGWQVWRRGLLDMSAAQLATGLVALADWEGDHLPSLPQFRALCRRTVAALYHLPATDALRGLPPPEKVSAPERCGEWKVGVLEILRKGVKAAQEAAQEPEQVVVAAADVEPAPAREMTEERRMAILKKLGEALQSAPPLWPFVASDRAEADEQAESQNHEIRTFDKDQGFIHEGVA